MPTIALNAGNFEQTLDKEGILLIDWWAPWCGPCRAFAPVFEQASEDHQDVTFAKINTDEEQQLAGEFQIQGIPTLMAFRDRVLVFAQAGALPASALQDLIRKVKELDMAEVHRQIAEQEKALEAEGRDE